MTDRQRNYYNMLVDLIENLDVLQDLESEKLMWYCQGFLKCLDYAEGKLTKNERNEIIGLLVKNGVL